MRLLPAAGIPTGKGYSTCRFPLFNTGGKAPAQGQHPEDVSAYLDSDVYRLSATVEGRGWTVSLPNALASAEAAGARRRTSTPCGRRAAAAWPRSR
nr:hypothetical protein GCM10020093_042870 [Planobispora longispora]